MKIAIRQAGPPDAAAIAPLFDGYRQFYGQASDLELAQAFIRERLTRHEAVIFLAENERGQAIGFTQLYSSFSSVGTGKIWILNDLFVSSLARNQGVGRALLNAAKGHARSTGALRLELSTARDNPAQKLYESVGYQQDTTYLHYSLELK